MIDRGLAASLLDEVVVATTVDPLDDELEAFAQAQSVRVVRGSVEDVLDRFRQAAEETRATVIVRLTADDPFKDPDVIDLVCGRLLESPTADYVSNTIRPTFPVGIDVEAIRRAALLRAAAEAESPFDREHVTPYVIGRPEQFRLASVEHDVDLSELRWTIDFTADLEFADAVYRRLAPDALFGLQAVLDLLDNDRDIARLHRLAVEAADAASQAGK